MQKAENRKYEEETKSIDIDAELIQITELADEDIKAIIGRSSILCSKSWVKTLNILKRLKSNSKR